MMNTIITYFFIGSIIFSTVNLTACSLSLTQETEIDAQESTNNDNEKPLRFRLNSNKADSLKLLEKHEEPWNVKIFCEDDFTILPDWSIYTGTPQSIANLHLSEAYLTFNDQNLLQRVVFYESTESKDKQDEVYNKLERYLSKNYTHTTFLPLYSTTIAANEVIKDGNYEFYTGYLIQDITTYRSNDGYISLYKRLTGPAIPPRSIRPSTNGLYEEYVNLGNNLPKWKNGNPNWRGVEITYFSTSFSKMYDRKCE